MINTTINRRGVKHFAIILTVIFCWLISVSFCNKTPYKLDIKCIESSIENNLTVKNNFDGIYNYTIKIKNKSSVELIKPYNSSDENYLFIYNQIKQVIKNNYANCICKNNIVLQLKVDFSVGGIKTKVINYK